jgi:hypothetical protein
MKQSEHTLALGLAAYSVSHVSNLDLRSPDELVLAVDGARGRKLVWVVQTSYGDVHAPGCLSPTHVSVVPHIPQNVLVTPMDEL